MPSLGETSARTVSSPVFGFRPLEAVGADVLAGSRWCRSSVALGLPRSSVSSGCRADCCQVVTVRPCHRWRGPCREECTSRKMIRFGSLLVNVTRAGGAHHLSPS